MLKRRALKNKAERAVESSNIVKQHHGSYKAFHILESGHVVELDDCGIKREFWMGPEGWTCSPADTARLVQICLDSNYNQLKVGRKLED